MRPPWDFSRTARKGQTGCQLNLKYIGYEKPEKHHGESPWKINVQNWRFVSVDFPFQVAGCFLGEPY